MLKLIGCYRRIFLMLKIYFVGGQWEADLTLGVSVEHALHIDGWWEPYLFTLVVSKESASNIGWWWQAIPLHWCLIKSIHLTLVAGGKQSAYIGA